MPALPFLLSGLSIVLIDLLLAGDNALIIALAARALPVRERRMGIACGAALAVVLRVALTSLAARLLALPYIELVGGLLVLWIALKVLADSADPVAAAPSPRRFWHAIALIVFADLTMSLDNIVAIAGASHGYIPLIVFGLCLSIPFVVWSSNLLSRLMDRYPWLIYLGAGILGKVAGDMLLADPFVMRIVHVPDPERYLIDALLIAAVLLTGRWMATRAVGQA
jgi:YjbE family integral membrane protein